MWIWSDADRRGWRCADCERDARIHDSRGRCGGPLGPGGGNYRHGGQWTADAAVSVSSGAAHLPALTSCPVAAVEAEAYQLRDVLAQYRAAKRLGAPAPLSGRLASALLVVDDEVERLRAAEARRAEALRKAEGKARGSR